jgi:membrane-associated phospholipid phosphatase
MLRMKEPQCSMVSETQAWPWLAPWNFDALRFLFRFLPHTSFGIRLASFFLDNPLFTTWLYAAVSYVYWSKQDDHTSERRVQLLRIVAAFVLAIILAALLDLKIHWPAPTCVAGFQSLFPSWLWNSGVPNSFPSHSTLAYLIVSLGLVRLNKVTGLLLIPLTFLIISLPRVYLGGHYPIDIAGSILLALLALSVIDAVLAKDRVYEAFSWAATRGQYSEVVFFLWLYELADEFHSAENTVHFALKLLRSLWT